MQLFRADRPLTPSFELIRLSMMLLRAHIWPVFYMSFLPSLVSAVGLVLLTSGLSRNHGLSIAWDNQTATGAMLLIIGSLWTLLTYPATIILRLRAIQGNNLSAITSFKLGIRRLLPFIFLSISMVTLIVLGGILFIIPGLILYRGFYLAQYYVIDQQLEPFEALRKSWADSKPNAGYIWGTIGVQTLIGIVASGIGSIPVAGQILSLAIGYIYWYAPAIRYSEIARNYVVPVETMQTKVN